MAGVVAPSWWLLQGILFKQSADHAVVDWNPSGLNIFSVYKHGSSERLEDLGLPGLQWLAARAEMVHGVPDSALQV